MIKVLILEDEIPAKKKLNRFLSELDTPTSVVAEIDTVTAGISFLKQHSVDLIISDIELLDGNSFEIYSQVPLHCPIIFTTAYDQFWMNAFENNGVDYLLKPFSRERFQKSWDKFLMLRKSSAQDLNVILDLAKVLNEKYAESQYKNRFIVSLRHEMYFLETQDIIFFEANEGVIFAFDNKQKRHLLTESSLKNIENQLNPNNFFRINRSEIISKAHIEKIERYDKNSLALKLKGHPDYLKTSQSKTALFREWIEQ
ncbi:MAG: LytTR family DNA-binding domain-containing protein [Cyclobacteriaceae bacterium]|nr:response regulator transcription factor [Cyclobacteriaceae bacterium]MCH8515943.1 LytTR family DNA-binding domain-containing protein [Cyclobacteriaceae bacterium]